jgi:hypothetical protein
MGNSAEMDRLTEFAADSRKYVVGVRVLAGDLAVRVKVKDI